MNTLFPMVFLPAVLLQILALDRPSYLPLSAVFFGLSLYAHGASYFTVPVYVTLSTGYMIWSGYRRPRALAAFAVVVAGFALPVGAYLAINHWNLSPIALGPLTIPRLTSPPRYLSVAGRPFAPRHIYFLLRLLVLQGDWNAFSAVP